MFITHKEHQNTLLVYNIVFVLTGSHALWVCRHLDHLNHRFQVALWPDIKELLCQPLMDCHRELFMIADFMFPFICANFKETDNMLKQIFMRYLQPATIG